MCAVASKCTALLDRASVSNRDVKFLVSTASVVRAAAVAAARNALDSLGQTRGAMSRQCDAASTEGERMGGHGHARGGFVRLRRQDHAHGTVFRPRCHSIDQCHSTLLSRPRVSGKLCLGGVQGQVRATAWRTQGDRCYLESRLGR